MHHRNMQDCMGINCIETLVACIESSVGGSNWNVNKKSETPPCMKKKLAMTVIKKISGDIPDHQSANKRRNKLSHLRTHKKIHGYHLCAAYRAFAHLCVCPTCMRFGHRNILDHLEVAKVNVQCCFLIMLTS